MDLLPLQLCTAAISVRTCTRDDDARATRRRESDRAGSKSTHQSPPDRSTQLAGDAARAGGGDARAPVIMRRGAVSRRPLRFFPRPASRRPLDAQLAEARGVTYGRDGCVNARTATICCCCSSGLVWW